MSCLSYIYGTGGNDNRIYCGSGTDTASGDSGDDCKATVENVPAGLRTLQVIAADGQSWTGSVVTTGEDEVTVTLE